MISREEGISAWSKVVYLKRTNKEKGQCLVVPRFEVVYWCPVTIYFWTGREDTAKKISE
jgi:hypothetical protein